MMRLFLAGLALLVPAFIVHVIAWRIHLPKRSIRTLLCVFAVTPLVAVPIYAAFGLLPAFADTSWSDAARILLFYVSYSLVYVCIYSAVEGQSPSLAIVLYVAKCGSAGCTDADFSDHITDDESISTRLAAMQAAKMIVVSEGRCTLTPQGRLWAALFEFAGNIFRLPLGG
jgi:hypothetical protein